MKKIAIFASGTGSNAVNLTRYFSDKNDAKVALLISDNPAAPVLKKIEQMGVPSEVVTKEQFQNADYMLSLFKKHDISFIILAGFLKMLPLYMVEAYENRIINIHPSLLPKYGGKGMYGMRVHEAVIAAGDDISGITIHYVNPHYDEGKIIFQATCPVLPNDTPEEVARKVHELEYEHFPKVAEKLLSSI